MQLEDLILVSVDDHVVEPPDLFEGRLPQKYAEVAPKLVRKDSGIDVWQFMGAELPNIGLNAVAMRGTAARCRSLLLLQGLLRAEWGFAGIVMATAGEVLALAERHRVAETADAALALAIESGVQVVLAPAGDDEIPRRLLRLLVEGRIARWLVDAAVASVLQLKSLWACSTTRPRFARRCPACAAGAGARAMAGSTVLLTDPRGVLPIGGPGEILVTAAGPRSTRAGCARVVGELARRHPDGARAVDPHHPHR